MPSGVVFLSEERTVVRACAEDSSSHGEVPIAPSLKSPAVGSATESHGARQTTHANPEPSPLRHLVDLTAPLLTLHRIASQSLRAPGEISHAPQNESHLPVIPIHVLKEYMDHAKITTTQEYYLAAQTEDADRARAAMNAMGGHDESESREGRMSDACSKKPGSDTTSKH